MQCATAAGVQLPVGGSPPASRASAAEGSGGGVAGGGVEAMNAEAEERKAKSKARQVGMLLRGD